MEIGEGKKRQRSSQFSLVFNEMDLGKTNDGLLMFLILRY